MRQRFNPYIIDCSVLNEQYDFFPVGYEFFLRTVRFYEIQFITGGSPGKLIIDGQHHEPRKGDLFFYKPGMKVEGVAGFYSYIVSFDPVYLESRQHFYQSDIPFWASDESTTLPDDGYFDDLPFKYNTTRFNELEPLFSKIFLAWKVGRQTSQPRMKAALLQIMNIIDEDLDDTRTCAGPSVRFENRTANQYYERVMASRHYIDKHLGHKLSLETLALHFGSSPSFFSRIFKKTIGITPIEYIIKSRLTLARELITTTAMSIEQVASACGFDNISYFYRLFKRHFNISPALLGEGYRNQSGEINGEKADGNLAVQSYPSREGNTLREGNPLQEGNPTGEMADSERKSLSSYPYIIDYTYNNQPKYLFPVGVRMGPREVRFYEIELIIGGAGKEITDGRHFKAARGDIFIRKPGMLTQGISGYYFYEIAFDPEYSETRRYCYESPIPFYLADHRTILPDNGFFPHFPYKYHTSRFLEFEPLFAKLVQSFPKRKEEQSHETRANLFKILTMMNEELSTHRQVFFESLIIKNNYEKIMICKKLIDEHPEYKFSLRNLADKIGLSQNFFCKMFRQIIGNSPLEYVNEARIQLAKNLLATTVLSVEEISSRSGFDDVAYFYRIFKRHTNMTPNTYRQKLGVSQK
jgi:transcriptional regulator GlxA family with amidase domain